MTSLPYLGTSDQSKRSAALVTSSEGQRVEFAKGGRSLWHASDALRSVLVI
jgi:quercetin dioxygenase-like cupin family protein